MLLRKQCVNKLFELIMGQRNNLRDFIFKHII